MRAVLCLAARGIVRDAETGTISTYSILEQIGSEGMPFFFQDLSVLAMWKREEGDPPDLDVQFRLRNNDQVLLASPVRISFGAGRLHRSIIGLKGLIVREVGEVHFEFLQGEAELCSYSVEVSAPAPRATTGTAPATQTPAD